MAFLLLTQPHVQTHKLRKREIRGIFEVGGTIATITHSPPRNTYTHIHTNAHTQQYIYILLIYLYIYLYIYTYTHTHRYTCVILLSKYSKFSIQYGYTYLL